MTIKTLLSHTLGNSDFGLANATQYSFKPYDRGDYHHSSHGWHTKGGHGIKGGSAINALTLLAFLFFLNILQTCLRDNMVGPQTPIVVVVTNETTETNATRTKREINDNKREDKKNCSIKKIEIMMTVQDIVGQQQNEDKISAKMFSENTPRNRTSKQQFIDIMNNSNRNWNNATKRNSTNYTKLKFSYQPDNGDEEENTATGITNYHKGIENYSYEILQKPTITEMENNDNENENNFDELQRKKKPHHQHKKKKKKPEHHYHQHHHYHEPDHHHKPEPEKTLLQSLMWNTVEAIKSDFRTSVEDKICCQLVACESSRISKKLGGKVKHFIDNYFNKGLDWLCTVEEKTIKKAIHIGRQGKSCAEELDICEPHNIITEIVLLLDYFII